MAADRLPFGFMLPPDEPERDEQDPDEAEAARRVANLLSANRARRPADPEGMGGDTWRPVR